MPYEPNAHPPAMGRWMSPRRYAALAQPGATAAHGPALGTRCSGRQLHPGPAAPQGGFEDFKEPCCFFSLLCAHSVCPSFQQQGFQCRKGWQWAKAHCKYTSVHPTPLLHAVPTPPRPFLSLLLNHLTEVLCWSTCIWSCSTCAVFQSLLHRETYFR